MDEAAQDQAESLRLLEMVQTGDREAFGRLCARHRPYLRKVIALRLDDRLRSRVDPSDVVQEAQLEAFRRLPDYLARQPMSFRLWLRKTAHERLLMLRRLHLGAACRDVRREAPLPDASSVLLARQLLAPGPTPSQQAVGRERARRVREAVAQLSESDREILVLRNLEELSNEEAAEVLGVNPAAASQRYGRALLRLRKILASHSPSESQP
jgi:RNA polymerase sigma-70 factor (ECF subfamily)